MKSYYTDYTNHMLRVYFAKPINHLTEVETVNMETVRRVIGEHKCQIDEELLNECLAYVYNPPCEDFSGRVEQFAALKGIKVKDVYAILAKMSKTLATERGLL